MKCPLPHAGKTFRELFDVSTKERLALVLEAVGRFEMAAKAKMGHYDDIESASPTPIMDLVRDLRVHGHEDIAKRAMDGEWDASMAELEAWVRFKDGRKSFDK